MWVVDHSGQSYVCVHFFGKSSQHNLAGYGIGGGKNPRSSRPYLYQHEDGAKASHDSFAVSEIRNEVVGNGKRRLRHTKTRNDVAYLLHDSAEPGRRSNQHFLVFDPRGPTILQGHYIYADFEVVVEEIRDP